MQPLQYDLRCPAAKDNSITHAAAVPSNLDAANYNAFCSITSQTCTDLRTWQHQMTTIMQQFHCDPQPQIQSRNEKNYAHRRNHSSLQNTEEEPIRDRNGRSRTRRTHEVPFIAGCSPFTRKNARFCAPASSPKQSPSLQCILQHTLHHHFRSSPLPVLTPSLRHNFPYSPLPFVTTSHRHHFPSSPRPFVTTYLPHHFPSSPLPKVTTSQSHHTPLVTTSQRHHFPSFTTLP